MISLVAFLGNIGREYERTRHNAAWIAVDHVSICAGISWQRKFCSRYGRFPVSVTGGQTVHALKPETYMNLSGEAVGEAVQFFKIPSEEILIVHDELELPPATLSLKWAGGLGGHNGLRSVKAALGTADFWRLRIGIGRPDGKKSSSTSHPDIAGYVLSPFSQQEFSTLTQAVQQLEPLFTALLTEHKEPQTLLPLWSKVPPMEKAGSLLGSLTDI